jgi:hypothetical protein
MDRSLGGPVDKLLQAASAKAGASLAMSQALVTGGYAGPAYVWAVRSVEVFIKDFVLLPLYLEENGGDFQRAAKRVRDVFQSGKWDRALREIDTAFGPLEPMLTEDNRDVWSVWKSIVVGYRGDIVHGRAEPTLSDTETVVKWSEMMQTQLKLRLIVAGKHPLHDLFAASIRGASQLIRANDEIEDNATK